MSDELSAESIQARKDARMLQRGGHPKYCRCEWCRVDELADELEAAAPAFAKDRAALAEQLENPPAAADSPPPVSETAAWTERDEAHLHHVLNPDTPSYVYMPLEKTFAVEIRRLRADNERMVDAMHEANAKLYHEAESLRSALAAAQEAPSETDAAAKEQWRSDPPYPIWLVERTDNGYAEWLKSSIGLALVWTTEASEALWHETEDEAHAMIRSVRKSGHYMPTAHVTDHRFLVRTTTSRSRVSDNG